MTKIKPTLLVLAAGMGSRFGGLKQIEPMDATHGPLLEYSAFDAINAGFGKIVFIIRSDFEDRFRDAVTSKIPEGMPVDFVYQEQDSLLPAGFSVPAIRKTKPWGTTHAILCAKDKVKEPFAVVNADDFYGRSSIKIAYDYLSRLPVSSTDYAMVGFRLDKVLGTNVSRAICQEDTNGLLTHIEEKTQISLDPADGKIYNTLGNGQKELLAGDMSTSMNLWCCTPTLFKHLDRLWHEFIKKHGTEEKSECLIPNSIGQLIREKHISCKVLQTNSIWFGMTQRDDKKEVHDKLEKLIAKGEYPNDLWDKYLWENFLWSNLP